MPTVETTASSTQAKLFHEVREPANTVDMVPQLQHNSLISGGKFAGHTQGSINNKEPGISEIINNNSQNVKHYIAFPTSNYWTPIYSQVK